MNVDHPLTPAFALQREVFIRDHGDEVNALKISTIALLERFVDLFKESDSSDKLKKYLQAGNHDLAIQALRVLQMSPKYQEMSNFGASNMRWEIVDAYGFLQDAESTHWRFLDLEDRKRHMRWAKEKAERISEFIQKNESQLQSAKPATVRRAP